MKLNNAALAAAAATGSVLAGAAYANLVLLGQADLHGQGIGASTNPMTGASQSLTSTVANPVVANASQLPLIGALSEPGVENLPRLIATNKGSFTNQTVSPTVNVFDATGQLQSLASGTTLNQVAGEVRGSGLVVGLETAQATELNNLLTDTAGADVFTAGATFADAQGGLGVVHGAGFSGTQAAIPQPEAYALMIAALGAIGFIARRRKQKETRTPGQR